VSGIRIVVATFLAILLTVTMVLLGVAISVSRTVLNADFVVAQVDEVPVYTFFAEEAKQRVPAGGEFLLPLIDEAAADLEPWAKEQVAVVVRAAERYIKAEGPFIAVISFEEPKRYLSGRLEAALLELGLFDLNQISEQQWQVFLAQIKAEVDARIPDRFELTEAFLDPGTLGGLRTAREYAGYVTLSLRILPVVALVVLLLLAWVLAWSGRFIARFAGGALLLAGIISVVAGYAVQSVVPGMLPPEIPSLVMTALPDIIAAAVRPLVIYGVVVGVVGLVLVIVSFLVRPATV
jgi:hypothetical protein